MAYAAFSTGCWIVITDFGDKLLTWFDQHGRKDLPWQRDSDPYKIWLSEIMLQQTQVATVIPYFERFLRRFPTVVDLAAAEQDQVLHLWSGLGYYARARNLQAAAQQIVERHAGRFPDSQEELESLPGIGRSTAGAIRAQAFAQQAPILDGNVKRVLTRLWAISEWPGATAVQQRLWSISEQLLPEIRLRDYTQALMDLGATLCKRSKPLCGQCPFHADCHARAQGLQSGIPVSKPKKVKPVRKKVFLVLLNSRGEILLEKRPPTGIWGGLWSFPELNGGVTELVEHQLPVHLSSIELDEGQWLPEGSHQFSHFRLNYKPLLLKLGAMSSSQQIQDANQWIWYSKAKTDTLGLAAPVNQLLNEIIDNQ